MGAVLDSTVSPLVAHVPGASNESDGSVAPTALHYGNPLVEQSRLSTRPGLVDQWDRVAVKISGEQRSSWLNDLISQKVNAIAPGQATFGLILDLQGRVEHYFGISALEDCLILDSPAAQADALVDYLSKMIFWAQVEVTRLPWAKLTLVGCPLAPGGELFPAAGSGVAGRGGDSLPSDAAGSGAPPAGSGISLPAGLGALVWRSHSTAVAQSLDLWVPAERVAEAWDALSSTELTPAGAPLPVGRMAWDALRIQAREPILGVDTDERTIPHEVPVFIGKGIAGATQLGSATDGPTEAAVHLNKGCYRGQETVSRVHNLGKSPRVLVLLHLDGSANVLPEPGAVVSAGKKNIGRVGSSTHDADLGPVALALVKRAVVEKLATDPAAVPPLLAGEVDAAIDPADVVADTGERPGRAAINKLRGR